MSVICPRCLYEFFAFADLGKPGKTKVLSHECTSGYIRPFPADICKDCAPHGAKEKPRLMSVAHITHENRQRKTRKIKELEAEVARDIEILKGAPKGDFSAIGEDPGDVSVGHPNTIEVPVSVEQS